MTSKKILITRPLEDAEVLSEQLETRGHQVEIAPMLDIYVLDAAEQEITEALSKNPQAILLTSGNGARALAHLTDRRDIPVIAVGEASAMAAQQRGFDAQFCANGDVEKLEEYILKNCKKEAGSLLHIAGSVVAGQLKENLTAKGYEVDRVVAYLAKPVSLLSQKVKDDMRDGEIDAIMFYSPRTAAIFVDLLISEELEDTTGAIEAYCLSPRVADKISELSWKSVHRAEYPTQAAILALIDDNESINKIAS